MIIIKIIIAFIKIKINIIIIIKNLTFNNSRMVLNNKNNNNIRTHILVNNKMKMGLHRLEECLLSF